MEMLNEDIYIYIYYSSLMLISCAPRKVLNKMLFYHFSYKNVIPTFLAKNIKTLFIAINCFSH
jgi:hypothetical protein